jgi:ATP-binding cassette, subfamily B, bacterial PglK
MLKKIISSFEKKQKLIFIFTIFLTFLSTITEVVSLGSLVPLILILINPEKLFLIEYLNIDYLKNLNLRVFFLSIFLFAIIFSILLRLLIINQNIYIAKKSGNLIFSSIFEKILNSELGSFSNFTTQEIYSVMASKTDMVVGIIYSYLQLISSILILLSIVIGLLFVDYKITSIIFLIFTCCYLVIIFYVRNKSKKYGKIIAKFTDEKFKYISEGLDGFRYIILNNLQNKYTAKLKKIDYKIRESQENIRFIIQTPRYILEGIGIIFILLFAFYLDANQLIDKTLLIATIGVIAFASQRLLPIVQQIYGSYIYIKSNKKSFQDVMNFFDTNKNLKKSKKIIHKKISFKKSISFKNVNFIFKDKQIEVFKDLNVEFSKNKTYGIIGPSGSGKTILTDLIMGLRNINKGKYLIDNKQINHVNIKDWRQKIAHVPQKIFTTNDSIINNIALGLEKEKIDFTKIKNSIKLAQLEKDIGQLSNGVNTIVGSSANNFSAGQIQRLGIARALFKETEILILDEATSALDNKTEKEFLDVIKKIKKSKTIFFTTHKEKPLEICDEIYEIRDKKLIRIN